MRITVETDSPQEFNLFAAAVQAIAAVQREDEQKAQEAQSATAPAAPSPRPAALPAVTVGPTAPVVAAVAGDVVGATRVLVEKKGLPAAIQLLAAFNVKRASELPVEAHAEFIEKARILGL